MGTLTATAACLLLCLSVHSQAQIFPSIHFMGKRLENHSYVNLSHVRNAADGSVQCCTDLSTCCSRSEGGQRGDWYFPNETRLNFSNSVLDIYEHRVNQSVEIRRRNTKTASGIYRCEIETIMSNNSHLSREILYIGLYKDGGGITMLGNANFTVDSDLNRDNRQFTLTCISTGGPATNVTWTRDSEVVSEGTTTVLDNAVTARYTHTLTVTKRQGGLYRCNVSNQKPSHDSSNFTVWVASAPENFMVNQQGLSSVVVSWSSPTPLGHTKDYGICQNSSKCQTVNVTINELNVTGLKSGAYYNISIVAMSQHLPSETICRTVYVVPLPRKPVITVHNVSTTTISPIIAADPALKEEEGYGLMWKKIYECSEGERSSSTYVDNGRSGYVIMGLDEGSSYNISMNATNLDGSVTSASVIIMTLETAPSAPPGNISVPDMTSSTITVQWTPVECIHRNGNIMGYSIVYSKHGSNVTHNMSVAGKSVTRFVLTKLVPSSMYEIKVAAMNGAGIGVYGIQNAKTLTSTLQSQAVVGVIVSVVVVVAGIVVVVITGVWLWRRKRSKEEIFPTSHLKVFSRGESIFYTKDGDAVSLGESLNGSVASGDVEESGMLREEGTNPPPHSKVSRTNSREVVEAGHSGEDETVLIRSTEGSHSSSEEEESESEDEDEDDEPVKLISVPVAMFGNHVEMNHSDNNQHFIAEFESLQDGEGKSTIPLDREKNRFGDIFVYDDNRVVLVEMGGYDNDYINASHVDGYSVTRKFIAAQGPISTTVVDFWRMVWQEKAPSIVMITNLVEGKKAKCERYWPESGSLTFGPFQVTITNQRILADYTIRKLSLELSGSSQQFMTVTHFHYTAWPDHRVPDYATPMLTFHKAVMKEHRPSKGPLLVHCSAGVGRTGTFITIDNVLEQIAKEGVVNIPGVIQTLRKQRTKMVQTLEQYMFIHDAILESVMCGDTQINAGDLRRKLRSMQKKDQSGGTELEMQFSTLDQVSSRPQDSKVFAGRNNPHKNRSTAFLPVDKWRVVLKGENPNYINATHIHGYKQQRAFIITQGPMKSTSRDFWKMVCDRKCSVIVMLSDLAEQGAEVCCQYWPGNRAQTYGEFRVELIDTEKDDGYLMRTFCIQQAKFGTVHQVSQFQITNWAADGESTYMKTVITVIEEMVKVQRRTGNHAIVVHCSDTVIRSAMFCAIATTIERCKTEGIVDVFQVVKALRVQKPGAIQTVRQYLLIFKAVLVFLDSFETYANFMQ